MSLKKKRPRETTATAIVLGIILSIVMGAANVYLGLKAGMTVSASIPAAVIAMGVLRAIRRRSILEANLVQTAASAGESLAAGIIFTMPALIMVGIWQDFDYWTTTLIALSGGLLGVLLMIPMRRVFIVDNPELKYPEAVACAEVLKAGCGAEDQDDLEDQQERASVGQPATGVSLVISGIVVGAVVKLLESYVGLVRATVEGAMRLGTRVVYLGGDISPALMAVGYIVGLSIAIQIFLGGTIGWLIGIPLLGATQWDDPSPLVTAKAIWREQIRFLGVGAMLVGGVSSIWNVRHGLWSATREVIHLVRSRRQAAGQLDDTDRNLSGAAILTLGTFCVLLIAAIYYQLLHHSLAITLLTTVVMIIMSFFFSAVASYIVGLVGNSNSPVSGMTITAVLGTGAMILLFGFGGEAAITATLGVAGIVCCVACTSGDVCNDLKTGYLVGATPRNQQILQVIGVLVASFIMAPVMTAMHHGSINKGTGGIGGREFAAPQAQLFASLARGFFSTSDTEQLPYPMIGWGVGIGVVLLAVDTVLARTKSTFRLHVMPVAVGMYLPFGLSVPILLGGVLSYLVRRSAGTAAAAANSKGVLITSGIIAGESLIGVLLGFFAYAGFPSLEVLQHLAGRWTGVIVIGNLFSIGVLLAVAAFVYRQANPRDPVRR